MVLKVYRFQKCAFSLTVHGVNRRQHRRKCLIGKTKTLTKWLQQLMNNHTASL